MNEKDAKSYFSKLTNGIIVLQNVRYDKYYTKGAENGL